MASSDPRPLSPARARARDRQLHDDYIAAWCAATGLRPSRRSACIHGLQGKGCPTLTAAQGVCSSHGSIFDHVALFRVGGASVLLTEPYADAEGAAREYAAAHGLHLAVGVRGTGRWARLAELRTGHPAETLPLAFSPSMDAALRAVLDVPVAQ